MIILSEEDELLIRFMLQLQGCPREVKAGLQRLCNFYEAGRRLSDAHEIRVHVCYLLWSEDVLVRRWAYKALALIGDVSNVDVLIARSKQESDRENQTWAMAAIIGLLRGKSVKEICDEKGLDFSESLLLAARLYAPPAWLRYAPCPTVRVHKADELTLKWACLLSGYDKAPENLFEPAHDNRVLLRELNGSHAREVSEYSI